MRNVNSLLFLFLVFQAPWTTLEGQTLSSVQKDPTGVAVLARSVTALGGNSAIALSCTITGSLTTADSVDGPAPIVIENEGSSMVRTELNLSQGQNITILNSGEGASISPDGSVFQLNWKNTIFRRAVHIPLLSQISEYQTSTTAIEYLGLFGNANRVALSYAPAGGNQQSFASITRTIFDLDQTTGFVTRMQFTNFSENSESSRTIEIKFSNYAQTSGVAIPLKQEIFANGSLESTLNITSVNCQSAISDSEFVLPN
jgi:hypothetical protein